MRRNKPDKTENIPAPSPPPADAEYLRAMLEELPALICRWRPDGTITYVNDYYCRYFGKTREELVGHSFLPLIPEEDRARMAAHAAALKQGVRGAAIEHRIAKPSGEIRWQRWIDRPLLDARGNVREIQSTGWDITDLKQAEESLRESESKFHAIAAAAQDAVIMLDDRGRLAFWNRRAEQLTGYTAAEVADKDFHLFLAPERYHADYRRAFPAFASTGEGPVIGKTLELAARRKDGTEFPIELSVSAVRLAGRWHAIGILRDIAERKRAEDKLKLFRALIDESGDGVEVLDFGSLRFLDVNKATCRDLGYSREELLTMGVADIDPNIDSGALAAIKAQLETSGAARFETVHRRKDGSTFPVEVSGRVIEIDKPYMLSIVRDITERKKAEQALFRANRALKTLSAGNEALVRAADEQALLDEMCRVIVEIGGYRIAWVGYAEQDAARTIRIAAQRGMGVVVPESLSLSWGDIGLGRQPAGEAIRRRVPQIVQDIAKEPSLLPWRDAMRKSGMASLIALPLLTDGATFGVLNILAGEADAFSEDEATLLQELATDLGFGIMTLRARQEQRQGETRLRETLVDTIRAIALTVEKRDPYTAGHQQRVSELCVAIARELGLDAGRIEGLRLGAMIHDIGKIYIPAEILNRPGKLTPIEFEMIKTHPEVGYDIVKDVKFPWPVAPMILQHHERLDGSGYPNALKGEAVILEARILAVADVVEAMSSHRPYRPVVGVDMALAEIEANRGKLYDPAAVDACLRLFRERGFGFGGEYRRPS